MRKSLSVLLLIAAFIVLSGEQSFFVRAGIAGFLFLLMYLSFKSVGKEKLCNDIYEYCFIGFLAGMAVFHICMIEKLRFTPSFDLDAIYGGAIQWVETGTFADYYDYFDWFPNNLGGLCFYYVIFRIFSIFTKDYFMIAACANEVLLLLTFTFIVLSAEKMWGRRYGLLAILMTVCLPPLLFMTDAFYTDSLSVLFPILLFYLSLKMEESTGHKDWKLAVLSGFIAVLGIFIKATVLIMVIAVSLSFFLRKKWKKGLTYVVPFIIIYFLCTFAFHGYMYSHHLDPELAETKNTPFYHWIMMGLQGQGGYNPEDYEFTRSFTDPEERNDALLKEIGNRISEKGVGGMLKLYAVKLNRCLGDGTLGLSDFLDDNPRSQSPLHQYLLYGGSKYGRYRGLCNIVFYSLLLLAALYPAVSGKKDARGTAPVLALCGIIIFLLHWETSPRYITNYVPVIILLAAGGVRYLTVWMMEKGIDRKIIDWQCRYKTEIGIFTRSICFRIAIYIVFVCIMAIMGSYENGLTFFDFLDGWKRWDAAHYITLAQQGYAGATENGEHIFLVFYPLYPWFMKLVSLLTEDVRLAGLLISTVCYAVGCVFFYKITEEEMNDKAAENALILISIFPFAFFFGGIATEALFFAVAAAFFYYLRKHNWKRTALFGFLACLTKVQGLLLAFSVLVELFDSERGIELLKARKWKDFFRKIIYPGCIASTMLLGAAVYLLVNHAVEGNPFRFLYYQKNHWYNGLCPIWQTIAYVIRNGIQKWHTSTGMGLWVPEMLLFAVYIIAILYGRKRKLRPMYMTYLTVFFLLTYSSSWLISAGRYTLSALPLFMLAGDFVTRHEKLKTPVFLLSSMLMVIYMTGYFSWKQIM